MLRLAVVGSAEDWEPVVARVRGVAGISMTPATPIPAAAEAILFADLQESDRPHVEACLSARKHVLIIAQGWMSSGTLESMSTTAQTHRVQFAVVNPEHFLPSRKLIRQQLDAGKLEMPGLLRLHRWEPSSIQQDNTPTDLPTALVNDLELVLSLMGSAPHLIYATQPTVPLSDNTRRGITLLIHFGFANGEMAMIDYSNRMPRGDSYESLSLIGSAGAVYVDDQQNMQLVYRGGHPQSLRAGEKSLQRAAIAQDFVDGLKANRDFSGSVRTWIQAMRIAGLVRESLQGRCSIAVEDF